MSRMTAQELKDWRKQRGLSQKAAAQLIGLHWRTVQEYENGNLDIPRKVEMAIKGVDS